MEFLYGHVVRLALDGAMTVLWLLVVYTLQGEPRVLAAYTDRSYCESQAQQWIDQGSHAECRSKLTRS